MDLNAWALYLILAAGLLAAAVAHYRRREPGGRGQHLLGVLRGLALAALLLLLFDPAVPVRPEPVTAVLIDGSLSMTLVGQDEWTAWARALEEAARLDADRVLLFGGVEPVPTPSVDAVARRPGGPEGAESRLGPALQAVLETAPARVVVLTDGALQDAGEVRRLAESTTAVVDVRTVRGDLKANLGLVELSAPDWVESGELATVRLSIGRLGHPVPESATVVLRRDQAELGRVRLPVPAAGRLSTDTIQVRLGSGGGEPVRLDARIEGSDAESADDVRSAYVRIQERPPGVALVSFRGGQEPRFLLPVLERALGLPVRGWLALPGQRFVRIAAADLAGSPDPLTTVQAAVDDAELVVLHGFSGSVPPWALRVAEAADRLLVFPAGPSAALPLALAGERVEGEWYPLAQIPSSPVAALLAGTDPGDAPPLTALWTPTAPDQFWRPLLARLGRRGEARPVVLVGRLEDRRVAVALGEGYWRWAFAEGAGPDLYDRLWSAIGGWLVEGAGPPGVEPVRPLERAVGRGEPVRWRVSGGIADSLHVVLEAPDSQAAGSALAVVLDTVVPVAGGRAVTRPVPPGQYRYHVNPGGTAAEEWSGDLTVETFSPELTRPAVALDLSGADGESPAGRAEARTPLRTLPWPYILVVLLLCAEWALRRRWGYR